MPITTVHFHLLFTDLNLQLKRFMLMKRIILLVSILFVGIVLQAQEVIATAGETLTSSTHQISFTVGETVIETIESGNVIINQGMHQSKLTVTNVSDLLYPGLEVEVFPNPTQDFITIQLVEVIGDVEYSIYDVAGKQIINAKISLNETKLDLTNYVRGTYFLKLYIGQNQSIQTFKIVKY